MLRMVLVNTQRLARYDYGSTIAFKLYNEDLTQFDATGYTGVLKSYKRHGDRAFFFRDVERALSVVGTLAQVIPDISVSWTTQNIGEGTFAYTSSNRPSIAGNMWLEVELTKSGEQLSSDLVKVYVQPSEAA
jgi:hypothetical protein